MAASANPTAHAAASVPVANGFLGRFISRDRVDVGVPVSSKKRLLEEVAGLLTVQSQGLDRDIVFQILNQREQLGSTGIGEGIALPHGRINGIEQPIICAMRLSQKLDFDSIDDQPVDFVIGLLVPADAERAHLQILARLAEVFSRAETRRRIDDCRSAEQLFRALENLA